MSQWPDFHWHKNTIPPHAGPTFIFNCSFMWLTNYLIPQTFNQLTNLKLISKHRWNFQNLFDIFSFSILVRTCDREHPDIHTWESQENKCSNTQNSEHSCSLLGSWRRLFWLPLFLNYNSHDGCNAWVHPFCVVSCAQALLTSITLLHQTAAHEKVNTHKNM